MEFLKNTYHHSVGAALGTAEVVTVVVIRIVVCGIVDPISDIMGMYVYRGPACDTCIPSRKLNDVAFV